MMQHASIVAQPALDVALSCTYCLVLTQA